MIVSSFYIIRKIKPYLAVPIVKALVWPATSSQRHILHHPICKDCRHQPLARALHFGEAPQVNGIEIILVTSDQYQPVGGVAKYLGAQFWNKDFADRVISNRNPGTCHGDSSGQDGLLGAKPLQDRDVVATP